MRPYLYLTDFELAQLLRKAIDALDALNAPIVTEAQRAYYAERIADIEVEQATRRAEYDNSDREAQP